MGSFPPFAPVAIQEPSDEGKLTEASFNRTPFGAFVAAEGGRFEKDGTAITATAIKETQKRPLPASAPSLVDLQVQLSFHVLPPPETKCEKAADSYMLRLCVDALASDDAQERVLACKQIGDLGAAEGQEILTNRANQDGNAHVRAAASRALIALGAARPSRMNKDNVQIMLIASDGSFCPKEAVTDSRGCVTFKDIPGATNCQITFDYL